MKAGTLEIRLLGQYDVRLNREQVEIASRPAKLLFAYLALTAGKRHPRERLSGLLWPDSDEANSRSNLRQALWRLRKAIGKEHLLVDNKTVAFDSGASYWLDTALLLDRTDQDLRTAVTAYGGELLPGYYEDWVLLEREHLQAAFERKMQRFLDTLEQQRQWSELLRWAEHWIAFGSVPEPAFRALMIAHAAQGDLAAAASAYERCAAALRLEVGVEPSVETRELYERLRQGKKLTTGKLSTANENAEQGKPRHNLPHQPTPFIGRERELAQISSLLPGARLLTLVGPGGTGKTRLAQQAAAHMLSLFKNGVYFISLAPIESPELIVQTIAETIGFPLASHEDPERQLLRHLQHRQYLLVLDNYEHLLSGASLVGEILQHAGQVKIMVTSREKLNLQEETIIRVEGLACPPAQSAAKALDYGAVKLFMESARQLRPDFYAEISDMPHIIDICCRLEGMPLAILLAAAWVEHLTTEEISAEIARSFDFLQAAWRDVPRRHQSVRAAFEPSWQQLTDAQRQLFARLAVFKGGFTRAAAETVAGATLHSLANLVNKSLLRRDLNTGRYEMHELMRQYAQEKLQAIPETAEAVVQAHAVYFSDLIWQQWLKLISIEQQKALAVIDADLENIRQSWRTWLKINDARRIRMYIDSFWRVYDLRGWLKTGSDLFGKAAATLKPGLELAGEETQIVYAEILAHQAFFMAQVGYADKGLLLAQESVAILRELKHSHELAYALISLQYNTTYVDDPQQAMHIDLNEIDYADDRNGQWKRAYVMTWEGRKFGWNGDYERANQRIEESQLLFEAFGDRLSTVWTWLELGHMATLMGAYERARVNFERAQKVAEDFDYGWAIVKTNRYRGNIATILGDYDQARKFLLSSLRFADDLGMMRDLVSALYDIATIEAAVGDNEMAVRLLVAVQRHPLSDQTRTFSIWLQQPEMRFRKLAENLLEELQDDLPADAYAEAVAAGRALDLDTAVLALRPGSYSGWHDPDQKVWKVWMDRTYP